MPKQTIEAFENRNTKRIVAGTLAAAALAGVGMRINQLNNADVLGRSQSAADRPAKAAEAGNQTNEVHISSTAPSVDLHRVHKKLGAHGRVWDIALELAPKTHQDVREISDDLETYLPDSHIVQPNQDISFLENADGKVVPNPDTGE